MLLQRVRLEAERAAASPAERLLDDVLRILDPIQPVTEVLSREARRFRSFDAKCFMRDVYCVRNSGRSSSLVGEHLFGGQSLGHTYLGFCVCLEGSER